MAADLTGRAAAGPRRALGGRIAGRAAGRAEPAGACAFGAGGEGGRRGVGWDGVGWFGATFFKGLLLLLFERALFH